MNIFNSLLAQLVKYDVHTTLKINSIHAIFYHILSLSLHYTCTCIVCFYCSIFCIDQAMVTCETKQFCKKFGVLFYM